MATRQIRVCDQCGRQVEYESIWAVVAAQIGPDGSVNRQEDVDLCPIHCRMALAELVAAMTLEQAAAWVTRWRTKAEPVRV